MNMRREPLFRSCVLPVMDQPPKFEKLLTQITPYSCCLMQYHEFFSWGTYPQR